MVLARRCVIALAAALTIAMLGAGPAAARTTIVTPTFSGLGSWIDIFDGPAWRNPEAAVRTMERGGATILFLQTASSRPGPSVFEPTRTVRFLRAAHERGMTVIAW